MHRFFVQSCSAAQDSPWVQGNRGGPAGTRGRGVISGMYTICTLINYVLANTETLTMGPGGPWGPGGPGGPLICSYGLKVFYN